MSERVPQTQLDPDELKKFAFQVWSYKQGEMVALMIHLGDELGLYRALAGAGPVTAAELAERTGLHARWLTEWLRGQVAARLLTYAEGEDGSDDRFELTPIGTAVLADEENSLAFAAGAFGGSMPPEVVGGLVDAFRTGTGLTYQDLGACAAHRTERTLGPWTRQALVPQILPALEDVDENLRAGAVVADIGCGTGIALRVMADAYPASQFHGYDPNAHAIERARQVAKGAGLENLTFHQAGGEDLPDEPTFDFALTFDCVHDMTRPDKVIAAIHRSLKPDGTWLIKDIRSKPRFADNLRNPLLAMMYAFSVSSCMSSALSEPDGVGLGTLGFNPEVAERMCRAAGFGRFAMHDFDDPGNLYYEVRH